MSFVQMTTLVPDRDLELEAVRKLLRQRERELTELNHRVANSLQLAAGFIIFQEKRVADAAAKEALQNTGARLAAVARLHRYLYAHADESQVDLQPFLRELCPGIADSTGLGCSVDADPLRVSGEMAQQLAIAINELAMNAGKHAYAVGENGTLRIGCHRVGDKVRLTVADGGKGLGDDFDLDGEKGLGMSIIGAIVRQLRGTVTVDNDDGARFIFMVPLPKRVSRP
jgi:two-component sensor histidine kinase